MDLTIVEDVEGAEWEAVVNADAQTIEFFADPDTETGISFSLAALAEVPDGDGLWIAIGRSHLDADAVRILKRFARIN